MSDQDKRSRKQPTGPIGMTEPTVRVTPEPFHHPATSADTQPTIEPQHPVPLTSLLPTGMHDSGTLGRFNILDILGSGGMGVVLSAYDPQLARKVAIKVLRTRGLTGQRREREAARLLREARAMAQLSHPHVVTVYEAGTIDDRVYVAMEYIAGQTLRGWLNERKRSAAEILDAYIKAGRGLAAGHHAGIIHRDFKPDNVIVGYDGRVRVIDFGLARPSRGIDTPTDAGGDEPSAGESNQFPTPEINSQLTTVGSLFGTPVYMAPEQHHRAELDARADQFAFCVALFEALYDRLPFPAKTYAELVVHVTEGRLELPPENPAIPSRVIAALVRGLSVKPDDRFSSMDELLDELAPPAARKTRRVFIAAALAALVAVAVTLIVVFVVAGDRGPDPAALATSSCEGGEERLQGVWDPPTKKRVKEAFLGSKRSHAAATYDRVEAELDRYASDWIANRREVCEATHVRHDRSDAAFDLGMRCLLERLEETRVLTALFAGPPDPQLADKALAAVQHLPRPDSCTKLAPGASPALPVGRDERVLVEDVRYKLTEVRALREAGKHAAAAAQAKTLLGRVKSLDYPPLHAELQFLLGQSLSGAGQAAEAEVALRESVRLAALAKDDRLSARAWTMLVSVVGFGLARHADAIGLQPVAAAAIQRAEGGDEMTGELTYFLALAHFQKGDYDSALAAFQRALELRIELLGPSHPDVAQAHNSLGGTLLRKGANDAAAAQFKKALEIREAAQGPKHPDIALPLANLGTIAQLQGRVDDAMRYSERALEILEEVHGPEHMNVNLTVYNLGVLASQRKDCPAAVKHFTRALPIFEKASPNHPYVAFALIQLADCRIALGAFGEAIAEADRAITLLGGQADPGQLASARFVLAKALWAANRDRPRANTLAADARKAFVAAGPAGAAGVVEIDAWLGSRK